MHQVAIVAFNKMVARHRESLVQYRKAMAVFILKTEVRFLFRFWLQLVTIIPTECGWYGSCEITLNRPCQRRRSEVAFADQKKAFHKHYSNAALVSVVHWCHRIEGHVAGCADCSAQNCEYLFWCSAVFIIWQFLNRRIGKSSWLWVLHLIQTRRELF